VNDVTAPTEISTGAGPSEDHVDCCLQLQGHSLGTMVNDADYWNVLDRLHPTPCYKQPNQVKSYSAVQQCSVMWPRQ
jgi:hypothetical protein